MLTQDQQTDWTLLHRRLVKVLQATGYKVDVEVEFQPWRVDCYLPELHMVVEADGPHHSKTRDATRDADLLERYGLFVIRVPESELTTLWRGSGYMMRLILEYFLAPSAAERREHAAVNQSGGRTPWEIS